MNVKLYTVVEISKICERPIFTVYHHIRKHKIKPIKSILIKGNAYTNYYSESQKTTLLGSIEEIEKMNRYSRPKRIPEVIYVTRESHFFESKSNFWSEKKIKKVCESFAV